MIIWSTRGNPGNLTVIDVPGPLVLANQSVWQDDFGFSMTSLNAGWSDGAGIDQVNTVTSVSPAANDEFGISVTSAIDAPLVQRVDADADAQINVNNPDIDPFGCLEVGGEFEGVHFAPLFQTDDLFLPRYVQDGTTLDCDTSAPLVGSQVFAHDATSGLIIAAVLSNATGAFRMSVFEPGPHLIRAVSGTNTAISLPISATAV